MQLISNHLILVSAQSIDIGITQVQDFFAKTLLVRYDKIDIIREKCCRGDDNVFHKYLNDSINANQKTLSGFIEELQKTGFHAVTDLHKVKQGYPSKLLHIITHYLDGFIGVDTVFYNLLEDSHWLTEKTTRAISANPKDFWLIHLDCYSKTPDKVAIVQH